MRRLFRQIGSLRLRATAEEMKELLWDSRFDWTFLQVFLGSKQTRHGTRANVLRGQFCRVSVYQTSMVPYLWYHQAPSIGQGPFLRFCWE